MNFQQKKIAFLRQRFQIFSLILIFFPSAFALENSLPTSKEAPPFSLTEFREKTLFLINRFRKDQHLSALRLSPELNGISQQWAEHIAQQRKLVHRSLNSLKEITQREGWSLINENLHYSTAGADPEETVEAWKKSPGHRKNLLDESIQIAGIGAAFADNEGYVVFNGAAIKQMNGNSPSSLPHFLRKIFPKSQERDEDPE
ncbi:YkwD [Methylacidiphilum kamchatkense Kam1]|uniref:YkwD n=1 Tax=Methylacidiphilum kamchatkense Kam1 TaxID=1202785 RepID=A0A516TJE1_9BACT|nr:YkwD [Methylacidiphilum kamchatkense Kam1]